MHSGRRRGARPRRAATPSASSTSSARCTAWSRSTDGIRAGTVSLPKGLWRHSTLNESTATALAPATLTDLGGGACFNDARVEVARILAASWEGKPLSVFVPADAEAPDK